MTEWAGPRLHGSQDNLADRAEKPVNLDFGFEFEIKPSEGCS